MSDATRRQIARYTGMATRERAYETSDGIEIESNEGYEVSCRRVFYDDIVLVTYHRQLGALFMVLNGLLVAFIMGITFLIAATSRSGEALDALIPGLIMASPSGIALILRLLFRVDVINVYGRRSMATLRYSFRKGKAREVYGRICARARQAQRDAAPTPAPSESFAPPMPPEPALP
jgi:hypothetical protein